jgi:hypothetical protein
VFQSLGFKKKKTALGIFFRFRIPLPGIPSRASMRTWTTRRTASCRPLCPITPTVFSHRRHTNSQLGPTCHSPLPFSHNSRPISASSTGPHSSRSWLHLVHARLRTEGDRHQHSAIFKSTCTEEVRGLEKPAHKAVRRIKP